jgi:hypothetical protein
VPTREKQIISTEKFVLTIFWSVDGFHVLEFLLTDTKFNTAYSCNILFHYLPRGWKWVPPKDVEFFVVFIATTLALTIPRGVEH